MKKKFILIISAILILGVLISACASDTGDDTDGEKIKVAFIYIGQPGDLGWTYEHDRGRLMLEEALGDQIETITVPDVPEGPDAEKAIRDVVEDGAKIVFWSNRTGNWQIWVMDADGGNLYSLSRTGFNDWDPVWIKYPGISEFKAETE